MESCIYTYHYKSSFGELIIGEFDNKLVLCDWKYRKMRDSIDKRLSTFFNTTFTEVNGSSKYVIIQQTISQLELFFTNQLQSFDIPLQFAGTPFQMSVWKALLKIPFGKTISYLELSRILGDEKAIRAVASANGANSISIIVPCHRVIGSNGELTGYAGGISAKQKLLKLENKSNQGEQLTLL